MNLITVFGGFGVQGFATAKSILENGKGKFSVRIATRKRNNPIYSKKFEELKKLGNVELVYADYDDYQTVKAATIGSYGVWFITWFWEVQSAEKELKHGKNVALACEENGIEHLVFSSLESPKRMFDIDFPTFDCKVDIEEFITTRKLSYTFVNVAWYANNVETFEKPKHCPFQGVDFYEFNIPVGPHGLHAINNVDVGRCFFEIFNNPDKFRNKKIGLSGFLIKDGKEIENAFNEVFAPMKFKNINDLQIYSKANSNFGDSTTKMYEFYQKRAPHGCDVNLTHQLNPDAISSFKEYLKTHKAHIQFDMGPMMSS